MRTNKNYSLVADIGGTNARFALVEDSQFAPLAARNLVCANYPTIVDAIKDYLNTVSIANPVRAALSVASPVVGDHIMMTNHSWSFSVSETRRALGLDSLKVFNDYTALALSLPFIPDSEILKVGGGEEYNRHLKAAIGPGTGLGVSGLVPVDDHWLPLESEGGHVTYGPVTERETQIIEVIRRNLNHVSAESLVSGPGISLIYGVITELETGQATKLMPGEVTQLAIEGRCPRADEALSIFCNVLGTVAGNLALTLGARGGVYIGGGIIPKMADIFVASNFRERFEQHGRFTSYLSRIPTYLINAEYPALIGAMVSLNKEYEAVGTVATS